MLSALRWFDRGETLNLKVNGQDEVKSTCGGCLNFCAYALLVMYIFAQGIKLVLKEDPEIIQYEVYNDKQESDEPNDFKSLN
jgi:hypothetical protein